MTLVPVIGAFITGFGLEDLTTFFEEGLGSVMKVVVMFIFAIIFFGILQDVGLFTPIIRTLIKTTRGNVVAVAVGTGLIGVVAHLDGSGSTTFLLTIPALLPLYQALHMSRYVLLTIVALAASVMNMVPWGGPLGRAGAVISQDTNTVWMHLIPLQGLALLFVVAIAFALGVREKRRISALQAAGELPATDNIDVHAIADEFEQKQHEKQLEQGYKFRSGTMPTVLNVLPEAAGPYLHVAVGMLGVPLDLLTSTDAYYFSVLPIVQETVAVYDISGLGAASALILGNVIGTFVSPFSPALWLALGLANAQMGRYLKLAFPIAWVFSVIIVGIAFATGLLA